MEEKVVLATVLRHFKFESLDKREDMTLMGELILRPKDGINVRLASRKPSASWPVYFLDTCHSYPVPWDYVFIYL